MRNERVPALSVGTTVNVAQNTRSFLRGGGAVDLKYLSVILAVATSDSWGGDGEGVSSLS